jgi:hypothetical protein
MRHSALVLTLGAATLLAPFATVTAAQAVPQGEPVLIVAHTSFESEVSDFDSSLAGCDSGTVVNGADLHVSFTPWGGVFIGSKEFTCTGEESGFTLRLNARFGGNGSTGSWTVVDGWGAFDGLKGSGSLIGTPVSEVQIDDAYTGSLR